LTSFPEAAMRQFDTLEPLLMFGLIVATIWKLRFMHPSWWIAIPALMFLSHLLRHESPSALGLEPHNMRDYLNELAPVLILVALLLLSAGLRLRTLRPIGFEGALLALAAYLPWGFTQQYALNAYFLNRFDSTLSTRAASLLAALLFSAAHAPNPFLMAITLPLGWCATLYYRRTRNLYLLGIAHAAVGLLLFLVVPDSLSHHLRVGPGWFRP
jgi:membrane protease YdiL (CAAX protease family)